jgi:hypothetical protein
MRSHPNPQNTPLAYPSGARKSQIKNQNLLAFIAIGCRGGFRNSIGGHTDIFSTKPALPSPMYRFRAGFEQQLGLRVQNLSLNPPLQAHHQVFIVRSHLVAYKNRRIEGNKKESATHLSLRSQRLLNLGSH